MPVEISKKSAFIGSTMILKLWLKKKDVTQELKLSVRLFEKQNQIIIIVEEQS